MDVHNNPTKPPNNTSHAALTRYRNSSPTLTNTIARVITSTSAAFPNSSNTQAISPTDAAVTPSRKALPTTERLTRGNSGPLSATKIQPGKKIPNVATAAPGMPAAKYPINVAVVNTGPGVTCPTATASNNSVAFNQCRCVTKSACKNANKT